MANEVGNRGCWTATKADGRNSSTSPAYSRRGKAKERKDASTVGAKAILPEIARRAKEEEVDMERQWRKRQEKEEQKG